MGKVPYCNYREIVERAVEVWNEHHKTYSNLVSDYYTLLAQKRALGIKLKRLNDSEIKTEYPDIPMLGLSSEEEVIEYILDLTPRQINEVIGQIDVWAHSHVYNDLVSWNYDARYVINNYGISKSKCGIDPDTSIRSYVSCKRVSHYYD